MNDYGFPREIEFRINIMDDFLEGSPKKFRVVADNADVPTGSVPAGLDGIVNMERFFRSFAQGAEEVVFSHDGEELVYARESDVVDGDYRVLLYYAKN